MKLKQNTKHTLILLHIFALMLTQKTNKSIRNIYNCKQLETKQDKPEQ